MNSRSTALSYYVRLQFRRASRVLHDNGVNPWLAIPLIVIAYLFVTIKLLDGFSFGEYLFAGLGLSLSNSIVDPRRFNFVKSILTPRDYRLIRIAEQFIVLFPFIIGLAIYQQYWIVIILAFIGLLLAFIDSRIALSKTIPTPFYSRPFEFLRGFRSAIIILLACYALVPIGLIVGNFNLGVASIAGIGLLNGNYFIQPEPRKYIWIFTLSPRQFLIYKIKTIIAYTLLSIVPVAITLLIYDLTEYYLVMLITLSAIAFAVTCMLAKYLAYPSEFNIVAGLSMGFSILFPPLMLLIMPVFYLKAKSRLKNYLR